MNGGITFKDLFVLFFPQKSKKSLYETPVIKITGEAYKKINLYSRIVSEITGKDIECGGILLNYNNKNDGVIRDAYLDYQIAKHDKVWYLPYESSYRNYVQQSGMSWAGMWHSHGSYPSGHSDLDDKALQQLHKQNKTTKACKIKNYSENNHSKKISVYDEVFYSPSIVINKDEYLNDGPGMNYYAEFLVGNGKDHDVKVTGAKLEIIEENNNIMPTLEEMVLEVGKKVKYKRLVLGRIMWGKKLKNFPKYGSVLEKYKTLQIDQPVQTYQKSHVKEYSINQYHKVILPKRVLDYVNQGGKK